MNGATAAADAGFPVSRCARCAREVLTHVHLDAYGEERRLCLHCDAEIDPREVRWVGEADLDRLGYGLLDAEAGGCGRPGCGRGNCRNRR
jgi:hypothetical protein